MKPAALFLIALGTLTIYQCQTADASVTLCPCEWVNLESSCYYFSKRKATWDNARSYCLHRGGDLALPISREEDIAILAAVKKEKLFHPWIGLVRRYDKKFFTVYGLKPIYTNWLPGEPNYDLDAENCGHYAKTKDERWTWDDGNCLKKYHFICEDKRSRR